VFHLIGDRAHPEAAGSSRRRCGVRWCRMYRVIPKRAIRIARIIQTLTRMAETLPCRRGSQSEPYIKSIRRRSTEEPPAFLARRVFFRQYPATATRRNSDTIPDSIDQLGSELCYEMAHEQRLIFERRYCRGYL
jgi:hypothetical protein